MIRPGSSRRRRWAAAGVLVLGALAAGGVAAILLLDSGSDTSIGGRTTTPVTPATSAPVVPAKPSGQPTAPRRRAPGALPTAAEQDAALSRFISLALPVYCGGGRGPYVALTFDDGPGAYTRFMLDLLAEHDARATFFVTGTSVQASPGTTRRELAVAAIGNHSWSHPDLRSLSPAEVDSQLRRTSDLAARDSGTKIRMYRPPYGSHSRAVDRQAKDLGMVPVLWDVDSGDYNSQSWQRTFQNVRRGVAPGSIVLMHENRGPSIRAVRNVLAVLRKRRLRPVTVPELLVLDPPSEAQLRKGPGGCKGAAKGLPPGEAEVISTRG